MSWRDALRPGSFRGVAFQIANHQQSGGRRVVSHQYPLRDNPFTEDLGRKQRGFSIECLVVGADYMDARDRLIDALEQAGSGTLVHPYYGRRQVVAESFRVRESTDRGGMATFSIQFLEAGEQLQPETVTDTAADTRTAVAELTAAATQAFAATYDPAGQPAWAMDGIADTLNDLAADLRSGTDKLVNMLSTPDSLAQGILDAAGDLVAEAAYGISALERVAAIGLSIPRMPFTTALRRQQARNQSAVIHLARQGVLATAVADVSSQTFVSRQDADRALKQAQEAFDAVQNDTGPDGSPVDDTVYQSINTLRAALTTDLQARGLRLPELASYTPASTLPALVIAYQLYGDADRDAELVDRNLVEYPGMVPGGQPLEVLNG